MKLFTLSRSRSRSRAAGMALPEAIIAIAITAMVVLALVSFTMFSSRSFAALFNYVELNDDNRVAMDRITCDVRQANRVTDHSVNRFELEDFDGSTVVYTYNPDRRILSRAQNGVSKVLLRGCDNFRVTICQRNPIGGSYDVYPAATPSTCKVVNVSWVCARTIFGSKENSESVQTARIVIRRQGS